VRISGIRLAVVLLSVVAVAGCDNLHGDVGDLGELIFGDGGEIPRGKLGVQNEFVSTPKGDPGAQGADIRNTLDLRHVRTSFFFDEGFLPSEGASPNFARFDAILAATPPDVDLLPVLGYAPGWLANRPDWKDVFIARYVTPVLDRYGADGRIAGWEIWNEPDAFCNGGRSAPPGVLDCSPEDYVDLVARVEPVIRARSGAPVVGAATTSINQSFPRHFDYNKEMVGAGLLNFIDVYNFHWYGSQIEKLTFGGIADFLNGTGLPVWCTESGDQGVTHQLNHASEVFPQLDDHVSRLERVYIFTYFDGAGPDDTFGLVANNGIESDLYQFLRDNP
jgi:putative glycosyl hydrolase